VTFEVTRVYADDAGETHFESIDLSEQEQLPDRVRSAGLPGIPTTTMGIAEMLERRPIWGLHPAPQRQLLVLLRGAFAIATSGGDRKQFQPGDCVLVEDVDGKGHAFEDAGEDLLVMLVVGVASDWRWPGRS
jgi:hypothetical protein